MDSQEPIVVTVAEGVTDCDERSCGVSGCERPYLCNGWCRLHNDRWRKHGDPLAGAMLHFPETLLTRMESQSNGCIHYTGCILSSGYGQVTRDGDSVLAHRAAYEHFVGPIPDGLTIDHECHNRDVSCSGGPTCLHRRCVNWEHLTPKPQRENLLASPNALANTRKTHCPKGHPYDEENTYRPKRGGRMCRECARQRRQERTSS